MRASRWRRLRWSLVVLLLILLAGGLVINHLDASPVVRFVTLPAPDAEPLVLDGATGRAFIYNRSAGSVSTIDTATGMLVRTVPAGMGFAWLAVDERTGRVFVSADDDTITMLDARSGAVLHTVSDTETTIRQVVVDERSSHVFVGHRDSPTITMLDARTGLILRHIAVCSGPFAIGASAHTGQIIAKCNDGTSDILDARSGHVVHTMKTNNLWGLVFVDEGTDRILEVDVDNARTDVLDAHTGAHLRTLPFAGSAFVDEQSGNVFLGLAPPASNPAMRLPTKQLVELDGRTGAIRRSLLVAPYPRAVAVDRATGHILVVSTGAIDAVGQPRGEGILSVLDGTSGAVLRTLPVGLNPTYLVIDERRRRVLVDCETASGWMGTMSGALTTSPPEDSWHWLKREALGAVRDVLPGSLARHVDVLPPPSPPVNASVTTINLGRL